MAVSAFAAFWFLPFVLPICFYVAFTDLREMRITNQAVILLAAVFVIVGLFLLPLPTYGLRLLQMGAVLVIGIILNAAGVVGAGDAKFAAAAAPYIAIGDLRLLLAIFAANLLAAFATHRLVKYTPLRRVAPDWKSWSTGWKFPMGLSLGGTLAIYLLLGAQFGA
ncbi:prepilin peptidase [Sedimentitalea arenosa]|jgi:prepilin peptidase CpaA|uniref:Prepilin peptidase n=1 Tax=Sedimentitalea arenosa TaxID=2798803 RepID=A0A8J7INW6_9RHOB|nr:prepilin peptidase [Arenibacterium arenosum]MBJ6370966.1 prepilin peptidase [Arenibacterium arenosum]